MQQQCDHRSDSHVVSAFDGPLFRESHFNKARLEYLPTLAEALHHILQLLDGEPSVVCKFQIFQSEVALVSSIDGREDLVDACYCRGRQFYALLLLLLASEVGQIEVIGLVDAAVLNAPLLDGLQVCRGNAFVVDAQEVFQRNLPLLATVEVLEEGAHLLLQEYLLLEPRHEILETDLPLVG